MTEPDPTVDPAPVLDRASRAAAGPAADAAAGSAADAVGGAAEDAAGGAAGDPTPPRPPRLTGPVKYKGEELDAQRGPGLGCFRFQLMVLAVLIVLTPVSVVWRWPDAVSAVLLFAVIGLLLITGQTIIFLLRLVAADRRGRRRPLGSATRTVGELEDEAATGDEGDADTGEPPQDVPRP